jgi:drug/metabolite transporter (DMT)-like permease
MIISSIWLPAALFAGLFQAWRTALQQQLRSQLTVSGAGLVRYLYGLPVAVLLAVGYVLLNHTSPPQLNASLFLFAGLGGLAQIIGTNLLIMSFGYGNFVVGTAFSKTEVVQAALFAWFVLSERLSMLAWMGVLTGLIGVLVLSLWKRHMTGNKEPGSTKLAATTGLAAGAMFALTAVFVKRAALELDTNNTICSGLVTLANVMFLQVLMHGIYVAWREPATWRAVFVTWRTSSQVGLLAALGSACWFVGFASAPIALVRMVGQIEVLFTLLFARFYLGEKTRRYEMIGLLLVAGGVVLALLGS